MSEIDLYLDEIRTKILEMQDVSLCASLFSSQDFFARSPAKSHPTVRKCLKEVYEGDLDTYHYVYAATPVVRERLAIQGYSAGRIAKMWEEARTEYLEWNSKYLEPHDLAVVSSLTFSEWKAEVEARALAKFEGGDVPHSQIPLEGIAGHGPFWDPFANLALELDTLEPTAVWVDLCQAFPEHGFDPARSLLDNLSPDWPELDAVLHEQSPIIVLTEGRTDQRIISAAMKAFYPEFADAYQFMEFDAFKVEGGASPLTKMVKAFAGIRIRSRMLAIFDNDAAGADALLSLNAIKLPGNLRTMSLPDLSFARSYPTEGPGGLRRMDVNGSACAIEMYLGRDSLTDDAGQLRPVRWTQYTDRVQRYQGEVIGKSAVTEKFLRSLEANPKTLRRKYPEMVILLKAIFDAFKD